MYSYETWWKYEVWAFASTSQPVFFSKNASRNDGPGWPGDRIEVLREVQKQAVI